MTDYTFFTDCGCEVYVDKDGVEWDIEYEDNEWGEWESCNDEDEEDPECEYEYTYHDDEENEVVIKKVPLVPNTRLILSKV